jgi:hypothetical protein
LEIEMQSIHSLTIGAALLTLALAASAQKPVAYPAKGQSASQQSKDDSQCQSWAKTNTGVDPAVVAAKGGVVKGAAAGAAVGAIGGNDVGNAAVKGAVIGGVAQRSRKRGQAETMDAQNQQSQASQQQAMGTFWKAYGACMSGRGYSLG